MLCRIFLFSGLLLGLISCTNQQEEVLRRKLAAKYPAVDSSTSAHPLQRQLACTIFQVPAAWSEAETANAQRTVIPAPGAATDPAVEQQILAIKPSGTHGAYVNLIEGKADVILVARAPSRDELDEAATRGVSLDVRPVALDAFAFLVHTDNPTSDLGLGQLRDVYSGKITQWHELGVDYPGSITAYQRNRNSGSQELMEKLVMRGTPPVDAPELITGSMLGPYNVIGGDRWSGEGGDPGGLGYTVYFYARFMFPHNKVKMIAVDGVYPDEQTIFKKEYPLVTEVFIAILAGTPEDNPGYLFREWAFTSAGQAAVQASGYVPIKKTI